MVHLRDAGKAKSTRSRALSVIREVYAALAVAELVTMNPAREVKNLRGDTAPRTPWLNEEALTRLLATGSDGDGWRARRDRLCLLLFVGLGWRRAEIARMCVEDFHDGTVTGRVKGNKVATVGVPAWLQEEIAAWRAWAGIDHDALLPHVRGSRDPISPSLVYQIVKAAAVRAGLPPESVTPHALRRTFATQLIAKGVDIRTIQLALNHASISTAFSASQSESVVGAGRSRSAAGEFEVT